MRIVIAKNGHEDEAVRGLRQNMERSKPSDNWDAFFIQQSSIGPSSWMPRFRRAMHRVEILSNVGMTTVGDLFDVHQGTLTGQNRAFVLSLRELESLPKRERSSLPTDREQFDDT